VHKAKTEMTMCANVTEECTDRWGKKEKSQRAKLAYFVIRLNAHWYVMVEPFAEFFYAAHRQI
jgi:hypothetical protein